MNYSLLRSKTFWTIVLTVLVSIGNAVAPFLSSDMQATVTTILLAIATIFHLNTAVKAGAVN